MNDRDFALATRIHLAIKDSLMTKGEFAHAIGLTPEKLSKVLAGKRRVSSLELALIAEASGWSVERLLGVSIDVTGWREGYLAGWAAALEEVRRASHGSVSVATLTDSTVPWLGCNVPPDGWWCSREPDYETPCAARAGDPTKPAPTEPEPHPAHSGHEFGGGYARAAALVAGDPDWMNATGGSAPTEPEEKR